MIKTRTDGHTPSGGGDSGSAHASSSLELDTREFGAVVAMGRYSESDDYPALCVQVGLNLNAFEPTRFSGCFYLLRPKATFSGQTGAYIYEVVGLWVRTRS